MANVLMNAARTYSKHAELIFFSALSLIIAFIIPVLSPFPTYLDIGSAFLRTSSVYTNLNAFNITIIITSTLLSLLFLSFAIVMINLVIKYRKTKVRIGTEVISGLERYTANVFLILFLFTFVLVLVNVLTYNTRFSGVLTAIAGLALTPLLFYAPSSVVIDERKFVRAMKSSVLFIYKRFDYFVLWLAVTIVLLTVSDLVFMPLGPTIYGYAVLIVDSVLVLPFILILQSEMYINRFAMLRG